MLLSNSARYHRRARPKEKHAAYRALGKAQRAQVRLLSAMLRLAVGLDRGQVQVVKSVRAADEKGTLSLKLEAAGNCELEISSAKSRKRPLERELGRKIRLTTAAHGSVRE
jgi:exopolyphosphatase/guanosine-5'-triphosphate,3'-diphosphate pyrophosphatase